MSSRAQVVNTPFFRGDKCLSTCRSFLTTVLSKLSSTVVIWRSMSVSGSVRNSDFYIRSRIRWIRSLSEALAYPHLAGPAYRMRLIVVALNKGRGPSEHYVQGPLQCRNWYAKITIIFRQSNFNLHYDFFINPWLPLTLIRVHTCRPTCNP